MRRLSQKALIMKVFSQKAFHSYKKGPEFQMWSKTSIIPIKIRDIQVQMP